MTTNYVNLHCHSHGSLLDGLSRPHQIAEVSANYGYKAAALTDHGNVSQSVKFAKECKKVGIKPILGCLLEHEEIITKYGVKKISDIELGNLVLTHNGNFEPVVSTMVREHNDFVYQLELSNNKDLIEITGEHPILIYDGQKTAWIKVEDLYQNKQFGRKSKQLGLKKWKSYTCIPKIKSQNITAINILDFLPNTFGDNKGKIQKVVKKNKYDSLKIWHNINTQQKIDSSLAYFLGLFCAEGWVVHKHNKVTGAFGLTFALEENYYINWVESFLKTRFGLNVDVRRRQKKGSVDIITCCLPIAHFLENVCGKGAKNKRVPSFVFDFELSQQIKFIDGLLDGDGKKGTQSTLRVTSKKLAWGFRTLMQNFNEWLNVKTYNHDNKIVYSVAYSKEKTYKRCLFDQKFVYKPLKNITRQHKNVKVFNFEVKNDHSYVGKICFHNCELYLAPMNPTIKDNNNRKLSHLPVLAKNLKGWQTLLRMVSRSNEADVFYYKPRLDLNLLADMVDGNIIAFSGHPGSDLANCIFMDRSAYSDDAINKVRPDALEVAIKLAERYQDIFGKGHFFLEKQLIDEKRMPAASIIGKVLTEVSAKTGIPLVATGDSHYPNRQDAVDQRVLLCSALKTTFKKVRSALDKGEEVGLGGFFESDNYHIPSYGDMLLHHNEDELRQSVEIADMCEEYDITSKPKMPKFPCPDGKSELDYLKYLCDEGWQRRLVNKNVLNTDAKKREYEEHLRNEMTVIEKANLSGYFLVVQDYVNWAKGQGWLIGAGRGSAAGCLVSYLTNITSIDPIPHDLLFSRFYNEGRNTAEHVSLPDIDIDVPTERRDDIINYLRDKYGHDNVCQIGTFGRLQAKAVIREVLRVHDACPSEIINRISKQFPDEARVADKMQADDETSLIMWTLKYDPEKIQDYCYLRDDGQLGGEYAQYFEQAMRLEGTFKSQGKHAAGVIVADESISNFIPMVRGAKGEDLNTGFEMNDAEAAGGMKLDILGNLALDKLMFVNRLLRGF